jgi:hypothetical protein
MQSLYFAYAFPFDQDRRNLAEKRGISYPSIEVVRGKMMAWRELWSTTNIDDRIIKLLSQLTGVTLPYPLEVCVIGGMFNATSVPLIIPIQMASGKPVNDLNFLQTLTHEICHRFVSFNKDYPGIKAYWNHVRKTLPEESLTTQNHIIIFSLLKLALPTVVSEEAWQECQNNIFHEDYKRAFDLMQVRGAVNCLKEFTDFVTSTPSLDHE